MADSHDDPGDEGPDDFQTPSMSELLRISIKLSDKEQLHNAALKETKLTLSDEDKAWLAEAMDVRGLSDADRMKAALVIVNDPVEEQSHKEYMLDTILWFVEDLDNANDFVRFDDGIESLIRLLDAELPVMRLGAAWIMGTLVQNNPKSQVAVLAARGGGVVVPMLVERAQADAEAQVRQKALMALSGLARNCEAGQAAFLASEGVELLASIASEEPSTDLALSTRALFLGAHLVRQDPAAFASRMGEGPGNLIPGCLAIVSAAVGSADDMADLREKALGLLLALGESQPAMLVADGSLVGTMEARRGAIQQLEGEVARDAEEEARLVESVLALCI